MQQIDMMWSLNIPLYFVSEYVEELFVTTLDSINDGLLDSALVELKEATPPPLCADFDKENRNDAIRKREERKQMVTEEVPATSSGKDTNAKSGKYCHTEQKVVKMKVKNPKIPYLQAIR